MPYLNLDIDYFCHPKTVRLTALLGEHAALCPIKLWCYVGKFHAENGILDGYSVQEIERIAGWNGEHGMMVDVMLRDGIALLSRTSSGFAIHDWIEHAGHLSVFKKRAKTAAKKRWKKYASSNANRDPKYAPNHTYPNHTKPILTIPNHTDVVEGAVAFDEFWKIFPRKDGKQDAKRAWDKLKPSRELFGLIVAAIDRQKASAQWTKDGGAFIPHAATWLNRRRWEDEGITGKLGETWEEQMRRWAEEGDEKDRLAAMEAGHDEK